MPKNREPEPKSKPERDQAAGDYLNAESTDGTRHAGCGQPWAYCFCGMPRPNSPR